MSNTNDVERAMEAFKKLDEEHRRQMLPILLAVAIACPRGPRLKLVVNNSR